MISTWNKKHQNSTLKQSFFRQCQRQSMLWSGYAMRLLSLTWPMRGFSSPVSTPHNWNAINDWRTWTADLNRFRRNKTRRKKNGDRKCPMRFLIHDNPLFCLFLYWGVIAFPTTPGHNWFCPQISITADTSECTTPRWSHNPLQMGDSMTINLTSQGLIS